MKNLFTKTLLITGLGLINNYTNAQTQDTLTLTKTSSIIEETYNKDKTFSEKKEYIIENASQIKGDKVLLETETKYSFREKSLGKPADPKEPKNILNRKQIDKVLDYMTINEYGYDTLGRLTTIKKTENYEPGVKDVKKSATYFTYEEKDNTPIKIWNDLNNNGKFDEGDKMKIYISELNKWVSQGE